MRWVISLVCIKTCPNAQTSKLQGMIFHIGNIYIYIYIYILNGGAIYCPWISLVEKSKHDIKKTWNTIANIIQISKNKPNGIKCILDNGRPVTDQLEIANKFNDFLIDIGPSLTKNMPTTRNHNCGKYFTGNILSSFQFDLVDDDTIVKTSHSIKSKSSSGYDGISTKLLEFLSLLLISPLLVIINQSLITAIYPDKWELRKWFRYLRKMTKRKHTIIVQFHSCPPSRKNYSRKLSTTSCTDI